MRTDEENAYIESREKTNDYIWQNREKHLYYSCKNKGYILPTVLWCVFCVFFRGGFIVIILSIILVALLCIFNNESLDNSAYIRSERKKS